MFLLNLEQMQIGAGVTNDPTKKARLSLTSVVTNERLRVVG